MEMVSFVCVKSHCSILRTISIKSHPALNHVASCIHTVDFMEARMGWST